MLQVLFQVNPSSPNGTVSATKKVWEYEASQVTQCYDHVDLGDVHKAATEGHSEVYVRVTWFSDYQIKRYTRSSDTKMSAARSLGSALLSVILVPPGASVRQLKPSLHISE